MFVGADLVDYCNNWIFIGYKMYLYFSVLTLAGL